VGAQRGAALTPSRVLFVTGKLAEPALRRTLAEHELPFQHDVAVLGITVAALMTTEWIGRRLAVPAGTDLVMLPGLVEGDPAALAAQLGVPVEKGPKDLRDIPRHFGRAARAPDYGAHRIEILAEINNAPRLERGALLAMAEYYRASGADVIDLGMTPGRDFPALADTVRALVASGFRVSIDSLEPAEIRTALDAGAELVLSVNAANHAVAEAYRGAGKRFVIIPETPHAPETLEPVMDALERWNVPYLLDPILEPIGFGFMRSLERYAATRRRFPGAPMMMGVGNVTELTAADTTGVNALLIAVCEELGVGAVLTTEVIPWARGSVREIDVARRLMHYAVRNETIPKHVDDRLVTVKDARILEFSEADLRAMHAEVRDGNFRIYADRDTITVFNADVFVRGTDIQAIFAQLGVDEPSHAFYLGKELARAKLAIQLGKNYRQEGQLDWGYLTPLEDPRAEHQKLTAKRKRKDAAP
jgi:dihydropteroate synthase-like protein